MKKFLGVCLRLSETTGIDVGIIRVVFVVGTIFTFLPAVLYFILAAFGYNKK